MQLVQRMDNTGLRTLVMHGFKPLKYVDQCLVAFRRTLEFLDVTWWAAPYTSASQPLTVPPLPKCMT